MSKDLKDINVAKSLRGAAQRVGRYKGLAFFLFVALIYSFILYRINMLSNAEPDPATASITSTSTKQPHIDPSVVQKIQELQDNSVNVNSLFEQSRNNPFQE